MTHPLLAHFLARVAEVSDVADVLEEPHGVRRLRPRRAGALGVWLGVDDDEPEVLVGLDADGAWTDEVADREDLDAVLDAAIEGRVRLLHGPRRLAVQVRVGGTHEEWGTSWQGSLPFPRPGWRRRARVEEHVSYRSGADGHDDRDPGGRESSDRSRQ